MATVPPSGSARFPAARADLCLDYANSLCWRGSDPPSEGLRDAGDLLRWCGSTAGLDDRSIGEFERRWQSEPEEGAALFAAAIGLREAIFRVFSGAATGAGPTEADLALLNRALAEAPGRRRLVPSEGGYVWQLDALPPTMPGLLAPVLWSAGDLLAQPQLRRVRQCANEKCLWLFLDDSKSGTRRWCSMSSCGNRAKAHRHYLRHKQD